MGAGHDHNGTIGSPAGNAASRIHRLDARAKLLGLTGVTVVAVSAPLSAWPVWVACAAVLVAVAVAARVPAGLIWRRARIIAPVIVAATIFIPFARAGEPAFAVGPFTASVEGLEILVAALAKAAIGTVSAILLMATTGVPALIRGLEAMRVPRVLTLTAAFMYRYLFVVAEELARMRAALASRGFRPRHLLAIAPLGRMTGAMFLRTYGRGERVYLAMAARGYTGRMLALEVPRLTTADAAFVGAIVLLLAPLRVMA